MSYKGERIMTMKLKIEKFVYEKILEFKDILIEPIINALSEHRLYDAMEMLHEFTHLIIQKKAKTCFCYSTEDPHEFRRLAIADLNKYKKDQTLTSVVSKYENSNAYQKSMFAIIVDLAEKTRYLELQNKDKLTPTQEKRRKILDILFKHLAEMVSLASADIAVGTYSDIVSRLKHQPNNYVISKDFFEDFKDISLENACFSHLPENAYGMIKLPYFLKSTEGDYCFDEFIFFSGTSLTYDEDVFDIEDVSQLPLPNMSKRRVMIAWKDQKPAKTGFSFLKMVEDYDGMTLQKAWESCTEEARKNSDNPIIGMREKTLADTKAIMLNLLVYINSGHPDIREYKNQIKCNSVTKEPRNGYGHLTVKDIKLVGYGWKKLPNYVAEMWTSKPHFGWRRCGKNWSALTFTYIKGCLKSRKKQDTFDLPFEGMQVADE